jgi:shikimate dehydrogenase
MKEFVKLSTLYGLLGEKLGHSMSPEIHALIFKELHIDAYYHLFEVKREALKDAVFGLKALGARGVNVTIPYKVPVMEYLDSISREAKEIGSVNTILFKDDRTLGYNTDYFGFGRMLHKNDIHIDNKRVVVLGSGGSAKGVLQYLLDNGTKSIIIASRDTAKLKDSDYYKRFDLMSYGELAALKDVDVIINCTPSGMYPKVDACPVDERLLSKFSSAVDLIYNPKETLFLKYAKKADLKAVNGFYMLVAQAVAAEELWNDVKISSEIIDHINESIDY